MSYFDEIYRAPGYQDYHPSRGGTSTTGEKIAKPNLELEYIALSNRPGDAKLPLALPPAPDDTARLHGPNHYEWMMTDPVVSASVRALILAILEGGIDLKSAVSPKPGVKEMTPEEEKSKEIVDFCWRSVERCKGWQTFLTGMLYASVYGNRMAEKVYEVAKGGEDKGKLVWDTIKVKPRESWEFIVDDYYNVLGVQFRDPSGGKKFLPREKVVILSWDATDGDPRGKSILRPAVEPCNLKRLIWPQLYKHLTQFGSASLVGKTAEGEVDRQPVDEDGVPVPGASLITPQQYMVSQLIAFQNGSAMAIPAGAEVDAIQPQGDGAAFHAAVEACNREIVQAILLQTRATTEAVHGSKADSQTGQDVFGLSVDFGREQLAQTLRDDCFRQLVALNYGEDVADEHTPLVTFGTENQDRAAQWSAVATLMSSKYLGDSQLEEVDSMMGLPIRDKAADEAKAKAAADEAMKQQQALAPPAVPGAKAGAPGDAAPAKPKPKPKPAQFAAEDYGTALTGPWHDADILAARAILSRTFPSAAAMRRWEQGETSDEDRRTILGWLVDDGKARLVADSQALMRELATDPTVPAQFASPFETVSRWREGVAKTLRQFYLAGVLALGGPTDPTPAVWEALRDANQEQVAYLDGYAGDILSGKQPRDATLPARSGLYGASIWNVSQNVTVATAQADGMTRYRSVHVGSDRPCALCRTENAKGFQPIGTLIPIGNRKCKANDHCHWEFRK